MIKEYQYNYTYNFLTIFYSIDCMKIFITSEYHLEVQIGIQIICTYINNSIIK